MQRTHQRGIDRHQAFLTFVTIKPTFQPDLFLGHSMGFSPIQQAVIDLAAGTWSFMKPEEKPTRKSMTSTAVVASVTENVFAEWAYTRALWAFRKEIQRRPPKPSKTR